MNWPILHDHPSERVAKSCIRARALISLCESAAWSIQNVDEKAIPQLAEDIQFALQIAHELLDPVQDQLDEFETLTDDGDAS